MSRARVTDLGAAVVQFFETHLPAQRGMSRHTVRSYRDTVVMLLRFIAGRRGCGIEALDLVDLDVSAVEDFLRHLEVDRHNGIATRNVRLAAIHTLARFLAGRHADRLVKWQAIIALPFKRGAQQRPPEHLAAEGVKALLDAIDRGTASGERDFALLALMFNTGARVQEVLDLRLQDVRLDPPQQVRLKGKGNKVRVIAQVRVAVRCHNGNVAGAATSSHVETYDRRSPVEGGRGLRDDQSVAWPRESEHDDALCALGPRSEAPGLVAGVPRHPGAEHSTPCAVRSGRPAELAAAAVGNVARSRR